MRPLRPRFTVRRLMILVAIVGLLLSAVHTLRRRRNHALAMAAHHQDLVLDLMFASIPTDETDERWKIARHHLDLQAKWWSAARSPWLPVAPDPPEPE